MRQLALLPFFVLVACAHVAPTPAVPAPDVSPTQASPESPSALDSLPVRPYLPEGWTARAAERPESGVAALMHHAETGATITVMIVPREGGLDVASVAVAYWFSMIHQGFRPTHTPVYDGGDTFASVTFSGVTSDGDDEEGTLVARESYERPDTILLFLAEWPPGNMRDLLPRVDAIILNTRMR